MKQEDINRYLNRLDITPWISRKKMLYSSVNKVESKNKQGKNESQITGHIKSLGNTKLDKEAKNSVYTPTVESIQNNNQSYVSLASPSKKINADGHSPKETNREFISSNQESKHNTDNSKDINENTNQGQQKVRLGAVIFPAVLTVYSLQNKAILPKDERELLYKMLKKCSVNTDKPLVIPDPLLVYPPLIPVIGDSVSNSKNGLQEAGAGFTYSLINKWESKWLIILGEYTAKMFPQSSSAPLHSHLYNQINTPIVINSMKEMLINKKLRVKAWEALTPLRNKLSENR